MPKDYGSNVDRLVSMLRHQNKPELGALEDMLLSCVIAKPDEDEPADEDYEPVSDALLTAYLKLAEITETDTGDWCDSAEEAYELYRAEYNSVYPEAGDLPDMGWWPETITQQVMPKHLVRKFARAIAGREQAEAKAFAEWYQREYGSGDGHVATQQA